MSFSATGVLAHGDWCPAAGALLASAYSVARRHQHLLACANDSLTGPQQAPDRMYLQPTCVSRSTRRRSSRLSCLRCRGRKRFIMAGTNSAHLLTHLRQTRSVDRHGCIAAASTKTPAGGPAAGRAARFRYMWGMHVPPELQTGTLQGAGRPSLTVHWLELRDGELLWPGRASVLMLRRAGTCSEPAEPPRLLP